RFVLNPWLSVWVAAMCSAGLFARTPLPSQPAASSAGDDTAASARTRKSLPDEPPAEVAPAEGVTISDQEFSVPMSRYAESKTRRREVPAAFLPSKADRFDSGRYEPANGATPLAMEVEASSSRRVFV